MFACTGSAFALRSNKNSGRHFALPTRKIIPGGIAMDMAPETQESSEQMAEQAVAHDLVMRILKLRWMGMDDEAEDACVALQKVKPQAIVLPGPVDTD
jgi:hypothetical protein